MPIPPVYCEAADAAWNRSTHRLARRRKYSTRLLDFGERLTAPPLDDEWLGRIGALQPSGATLDGVAHSAEAARMWASTRKHAQRAGHLELVVFGGSVSAGCGRTGQRCELGHSWARLLMDVLDVSLGAHAVPAHRISPRVNIVAKGAILPEYFTTCTGGYLEGRRRNQVIIVEFGPSVMVTGSHDCGLSLEPLILALRAAAPWSPIVYVHWKVLKGSAARLDACERSLLDLFALRHVDAILPHSLTAATSAPLSEFYNERDRVHPNLMGNELMALATARHIVGKLGGDAAGECVGPARDDAAGGAAGGAAGSTAAGGDVEWCERNASRLGVIGPLAGTWRVVDEGNRGIPKLGYLSTQPGEVLRIGPILPSVRCAFMTAKVSFLQSWRPNQGSLKISCAGRCRCRALPGQWAQGSDPFPVVRSTYAPQTPASLTSSTRFYMALTDGAGLGPISTDHCHLAVQHLPAGRPANASGDGVASRVRIDGVSFSTVADCSRTCGTWRRWGWRDPLLGNLTAVGAACATGAERGTPGHVGSHCFGAYGARNGTDGKETLQQVCADASAWRNEDAAGLRRLVSTIPGGTALFG